MHLHKGARAVQWLLGAHFALVETRFRRNPHELARFEQKITACQYSPSYPDVIFSKIFPAFQEPTKSFLLPPRRLLDALVNPHRAQTTYSLQSVALPGAVELQSLPDKLTPQLHVCLRPYLPIGVNGLS